jgi:hypothetical protein
VTAALGSGGRQLAGWKGTQTPVVQGVDRSLVTF